jgi:adenylate cyclase
LAECPPGAGTPRRILRSFAFVDLCGFIGYMDEHGDHAALQALTELRAVTRIAADHHGVRIAKWLGDGALIVGLDDESVLASVSEVLLRARRQVPLHTRAGISSGKVLSLDGDDYIGTAINVAARLCAVAPAGRILIADPGLTRTDADGRQIRVRGMSDPIAVRELDPLRNAGI